MQYLKICCVCYEMVVAKMLKCAHAKERNENENGNVRWYNFSCREMIWYGMLFSSVL